MLRPSVSYCIAYVYAAAAAFTRNNHTPCCPLFTISCLCELFNLFCFPHIDTHTHTEKTTHTHTVTNRNKNGKFCLLCHRHLELNFIYFAIATVIIVRQRDQERPEKGREKVVLSAGCFHQQQDAMLTTTVGLNNNTCRNIIFMPRTGYGVGWVPGAGWGQIVFMTRTRRLGSFSTLSRSLSAVLLSLSLLHPLFEIKN